jgi:hypothetical protein
MQPTGATSTAFGVELEPAVEVVPEALAQLIAGPEGHGAFGLVQQLGGRAGTGLVGDATTGEDVDDLGRAAGPSTWKRRTASVMVCPSSPASGSRIRLRVGSSRCQPQQATPTRIGSGQAMIILLGGADPGAVACTGGGARTIAVR